MSSIEARRPSAAIATSGPITGGKGQANPAVPSLPPNYVEHEYFFGGTATSFRHVGARSTVDVRKMFQGEDDSLDGDQLKPRRRKPKAAAE